MGAVFVRLWEVRALVGGDLVELGVVGRKFLMVMCLILTKLRCLCVARLVIVLFQGVRLMVVLMSLRDISVERVKWLNCCMPILTRSRRAVLSDKTC